MNNVDLVFSDCRRGVAETSLDFLRNDTRRMQTAAMKRRSNSMLALFVAAAFVAGEARAEIELRVDRFFDPCIESSTDIGEASGEACIVQAIFNAFGAEDNGVTIDLLPPHRDNYYPQLITAYAGGTPPDLHLLHRHRLPDFAGAGLLAPLGEDLQDIGVDITDWQQPALDAVTVDGEIVAIPFDLHANLWHINLSLLNEAGLVASDGRPILPASPGELLDHAKIVEEATGKAYLAADFVQYPIGARSVLSLLWQQGENIFDGGEALVDTAQMRAAITTFTSLFDAGLADPAHDYEAAQQAFLDGEVAVLINGTWAVDLYDSEVSRGEIALTDYDVADFPTLFDRPATWADSHLWAVPLALKTERPGGLSSGAAASFLDQRPQSGLGAHRPPGGSQFGSGKQSLHHPIASPRLSRQRRFRPRSAVYQRV